MENMIIYCLYGIVPLYRQNRQSSFSLKSEVSYRLSHKNMIQLVDKIDICACWICSFEERRWKKRGEKQYNNRYQTLFHIFKIYTLISRHERKQLEKQVSGGKEKAGVKKSRKGRSKGQIKCMRQRESAGFFLCFPGQTSKSSKAASSLKLTSTALSAVQPTIGIQEEQQWQQG